MASKRMFAKDIVSSDAFYSLSPKAQALYFHLGMNADDEGFCANTRTIMVLCKADESHLQELIDKRFIIDLVSVKVIKHWYINNTLRSDRKKSTNYLEEKEQLTIKQNEVYSIKNKVKEAKCQPNDNQMTTKKQPSANLDKYSIDKIRLDEISIDKSSITAPSQNSMPKSTEKDFFIYLPLIGKAEYGVTNNLVKEYKELFLAVDVEQELRKMRAWLISNPTKQKTSRGIKKFMNNWLSREQDKPRLNQDRPITNQDNNLIYKEDVKSIPKKDDNLDFEKIKEDFLNERS